MAKKINNSLREIDYKAPEVFQNNKEQVWGVLDCVEGRGKYNDNQLQWMLEGRWAEGTTETHVGKRVNKSHIEKTNWNFFNY